MKPILKSKTIAVNAVMLLAPLVPGIGPWVSANPEAAVTLLAAANIVLRLVTKERVTLWGD